MASDFSAGQVKKSISCEPLTIGTFSMVFISLPKARVRFDVSIRLDNTFLMTRNNSCKQRSGWEEERQRGNEYPEHNHKFGVIPLLTVRITDRLYFVIVMVPLASREKVWSDQGNGFVGPLPTFHNAGMGQVKVPPGVHGYGKLPGPQYEQVSNWLPRSTRLAQSTGRQ